MMFLEMRDLTRKAFYKVASFLGETSSLPESLTEKDRAQDSLHFDAEVFEHLMPYENFLEDGLVLNKSTLGFGLMIQPSVGADIQKVKAHAELLKHRLPKGFYLTAMLYKHHHIANNLFKGFEPLINRGGIYKAIAQMSIRYHINAIQNGYKNNCNLPAQLADYSCYLFMATKNKGTAKQELLELRKVIESELSVAGYHYIRLSHHDFKVLLKSLTSVNLSDLDWPEVDDSRDGSLSKQVVNPNTTFKVNEDSVDITVLDEKGVRQETRAVSLMVEKWPEKFALWSTPDLFANIFYPDKGIQCPFLISFTMKGTDFHENRDLAQSNTRRCEKNNNAVQRFLNPNLVKEYEDWNNAYKATTTGDMSLIPTFYNIVLFTTEKSEAKHVAQTMSAFRQFNFELSKKPMGGWIRYLASLPFVICEDRYFEDLEIIRHTKLLNHEACANLMPLIADFKGSPQGMLLPSYRHQLAYIDTFDYKNLPITNFNFVTVASSGSGKSLINQWRILNGLGMGERIFVIDLGKSYKHLCELLGGTYIDASTLTLNPFTLFDFDGKVEIGEEVIDNFIQIRDLLSLMASPNEPLSNIQNEFLLEAAQNCWKKHANKTCMDNVLDELRLMMMSTELSNDTRLSDLVILLRKFGREGIYGHMFNSDTPFISNHDFVVLEMGEFENNPDLLTIIMFVMIVIIQGQFYHSDKSIKKLCIIDEAWRFLAQGSNPISARFIEQGFRTARKYNGGFGVIFQQLTDLYASIQSQAIASSSDIKFIMRQGNFSEFLQSNPKKFNELQQKLIQGFGAANSQGFSNLMLQYQNSYSFHRYFADPFTRVLFSSNAEEFDDIERFTNEGMSLEDAVYKVAHQRYGDELCS